MIKSILNSIKLSTLELLATMNVDAKVRRDFYIFLITEVVGLTTLVIALGGNAAVFAVIYILMTSFITACIYELLASFPAKKALKYLVEHHLWKRNAFDVL